MSDGTHPCNVCKVSDCDGCIWNGCNERYECYHDECMLNCEESCLMNAYDDCYLLTGGKTEDDND